MNVYHYCEVGAESHNRKDGDATRIMASTSSTTFHAGPRQLESGIQRLSALPTLFTEVMEIRLFEQIAMDIEVFLTDFMGASLAWREVIHHPRVIGCPPVVGWHEAPW